MGYIVYHLHDEQSNCNGYYDSVSNFKDYLKLAKSQGMKSISISNHGNIFEWITKKQLCDKSGIKYIHGVETYLCYDRYDKKSYHIGLYAKNKDGVEELNELVSNSTLSDHFRKTPRIFLSELKSTSDNIIITTACLAGPLWRGKESDLYNEFLDFIIANKHRCFLEIQYHNNPDQITYNKILNDISKKYDIPLIAGTDTHNVTEYEAECRKILQKSKNCFYGDEDSFDLTWKTYDELVHAFKTQDSIPESDYMVAIENTNVFDNMIEAFELDYSFKYPDLYKDIDINKTFAALIDREFTKKINHGFISKDNLKVYEDRINEEFQAFEKQGMESFLYFMYELCQYCKSNNIISKYRGSVGGSLIAFILDIVDIDPIKLNTIFSRFCNADRISLADIDMDFAPEDRVKVYDYIIKRFTTKKTSFIAQFGKIKDRGTLDVLGRGLDMTNLDEVKSIKNEYETVVFDYKKIIQESVNLDEYDVENDLSYHKELCEIIGDNEIVNKLEILNNKFISLKDKYHDIFYYFDGLKGTVITKGNHPAGIIGSPVNLLRTIGVWYKDGNKNFPVSTCAMKAIDSLNFCKFDILGVKMIGILKDVYNDIGKPYEPPYQMNLNDKNVYKESLVSKVGCFQFEGEYAFSLLEKFKPKTIFDVALITAAIRPSGKSYRDKLLNRELNQNPSSEIDKLLKDNYGYIVYQEDTIKFLQIICGFTGSEADTIRRAIGKKLLNVIYDNIKKIINGYSHTLKKDFETAKKEVEAFVKMLIDSARYQFGYNHAIGYATNLFSGMYLRYYHPAYFITSYLNRATESLDYYDGAILAQIKGLKIENISFKKSYAKYMYDSKKNVIYKGLESVKHIGNNIDDKVSKIYKKSYNDFIDVLNEFILFFDKKQISILISLNYFSMYGNPNELNKKFEIFQKYKDRKQFNKTELSKMELSCFKDIDCNETPKLIKGFDYLDLIKKVLEYEKSIQYNYLELLKNEFEYYSYVHSKLNCKKEMYLVLNIEILNTVNILVYNIKTGVHKKYKMFNNNFYKHQNFGNINQKQRFKVFDLITIKSEKENKYGLFITDFMVV